MTSDNEESETTSSSSAESVKGEPEFLDENYSDQDSIQGSSHVEFIANSFLSTLGEEDEEKEAEREEIVEAEQEEIEEAIQEKVGEEEAEQERLCHELIGRLNLEIPSSGILQYNRVYRLPDVQSSGLGHESLQPGPWPAGPRRSLSTPCLRPSQPGQRGRRRRSAWAGVRTTLSRWLRRFFQQGGTSEGRNQRGNVRRPYN